MSAPNRRHRTESSETPAFFAPHITLREAVSQHQRGDLVRGVVRTHGKIGFIDSPFGGPDIVLRDPADRNRSLQGDEVYVELYEQSKWRTVSLDAVGPEDSDLTKSTASTELPKQPRGRVVCISRRNPRRMIVVLRATYRKGGPTLLPVEGENHPQENVVRPQDRYVRGVSLDPSDPWFLVPIKELHVIGPAAGMKLHGAVNPKENSLLPHEALFVLDMLGWPETARLPLGTLVRCIGFMGDVEAETEACMMQNALDRHSLPFPEPVIADAKEKLANIANNWEKYTRGRRDFRDVRVFTVDPDTARDLDDAVHIRELPQEEVRRRRRRDSLKKVYEIGVHIADVSLLVTPGSELDTLAAERCLTVYMPHKCFPMLPRELCDDVCSLHPNTDKLTFSVVFFVDDEGNRLREVDGFPPEFARSIINTVCRLAYEEAQICIDASWTDTEVLQVLECLKIARNQTAQGYQDPDSMDIPSDPLEPVMRFAEDGGKFSEFVPTFHWLRSLMSVAEMRVQVVSEKLETDEILLLNSGPNAKAGSQKLQFPLREDVDWRNVRQDIVLLNKLTQKIRRQRLVVGNSVVIQTKFSLGFFIDQESKQPCGFTYSKHTTSHELIEELMLIANRTVAEKVCSGTFARWCVLRTHGKPLLSYPEKLDGWLRAAGLKLNDPVGKFIATPEGFNQLNRMIQEQLGEEIRQAILLRFVVGFDKAKYVVFGSCNKASDDDTDNPEKSESTLVEEALSSKSHIPLTSYGHYALNFGLYSHFTSPIRRYPDILLHRFLAASLVQEATGADPTTIEASSLGTPHEDALRHIDPNETGSLQMQSQAEQASVVDKNSSNCERAVQLTFLSLFLQASDRPYIGRGRIVYMKGKGADIMIEFCVANLNIGFEPEYFEKVLTKCPSQFQGLPMPLRITKLVEESGMPGFRIHWSRVDSKRKPLWDDGADWDDNNAKTTDTEEPVEEYIQKVRMFDILQVWLIPLKTIPMETAVVPVHPLPEVASKYIANSYDVDAVVDQNTRLLQRQRLQTTVCEDTVDAHPEIDI